MGNSLERGVAEPSQARRMAPATAESFLGRVQALRQSWVERRQMKGLTSAHDFASQYQLLLTLHGWANQNVGDVRAVYGPELRAVLSPAPGLEEGPPAFCVTFAEAYRVTFALTERRRLGAAHWFISVNTAGPRGGAVAAGPERRNGHWTRSRMEEVLLSVLGAYERSLADSAHPVEGEAVPRGA